MHVCQFEGFVVKMSPGACGLALGSNPWGDDGMNWELVRSISLISPEFWLLCSNFSWSLNFTDHLSILRRARKRESLCSMLQQALTQIFSFFPMGEIMGGGLLFWHWPMILGEWTHVGKVKLFSYHSQLICLRRFAPVMYWNFSTGLLNSHKDILICRWLSKLMFCWGVGEWW